MKPIQFNYAWTTICLHWFVALSVIGLFVLGFWMVELDYYHAWYQPAPKLHQSIGILLFLVMLFRLYWRLTQPQATPLASHSQIEKVAGHLVHRLLYLMLFLIMISGYLIATADGRPIQVFEWFEVAGLGELFAQQEDRAGTFHQYGAYLLISLVALHALAALKHHFIDKDNTLIRMLKKID